MGRKKSIPFNKNQQFLKNSEINNSTFINYLDRFKKVAVSIFEWVNLPSSMDARFLEESLYYDGMATILKDKTYGIINTRCSASGNINIYNKPVSFNCYSNSYNTMRSLYTGLNPINNNENECILVQNNWDCVPTDYSMELFTLRLFEAERTIDVNIKAQKTPVLILGTEKQRLTLKNLYSQYDGNCPFIFGDKTGLDLDGVKSLRTDAPFVADKLIDYKKEIWNEALTFLGINNLQIDKKERLISDEANSNNELINLNLQASLAPRQLACKQFNDYFGFTGTDKEISVRVRSDLHNVIKNVQSTITDFLDKDISNSLEDNINLNNNLEEGVTNV